jgi:hypothetical protein
MNNIILAMSVTTLLNACSTSVVTSTHRSIRVNSYECDRIIGHEIKSEVNCRVIDNVRI